MKKPFLRLFVVSVLLTISLHLAHASEPFQSATSGLVVRYMTTSTNTVDPQSKAQLKLVDLSSAPITFSNVTLRYYFADDSASAFSFACDYTIFGCVNLTHQFVRIPTVPGANTYRELGFNSAAGVIKPGYTTGA